MSVSRFLKAKILPVLSALVIGLVILAACSNEIAGTAGNTIEYELSWNTEGALVTETGFSLTNDQSINVAVSRAYLVLYSTQLVPCEDDNQTVLGFLRQWLLPRVAHAGHGGDIRDPSAVTVPYVENLVTLLTVKLASKRVTDTRYCQIHYLVGRAEPGSEELPEEHDLVGTSLYIEGTWMGPDDNERTAFGIDTSTAYGALEELYPKKSDGTQGSAYVLDMNNHGAQVLIERSLSGMFDGIDWLEMNDTQVERQVLTNIIEQVQITVTPDTPL